MKTKSCDEGNNRLVSKLPRPSHLRVFNGVGSVRIATAESAGIESEIVGLVAVDDVVSEDTTPRQTDLAGCGVGGRPSHTKAHSPAAG